MACFDNDLLSDQLRKKEPEEWFVLHMLGCEECRERFQLACLIRKTLEELKKSEMPEAAGEPLDREALYWMVWMTSDKFWNQSDVQ